jgi:serine/threonine protein kinase
MSTNEWIGKTIGGRYQIEELLGQGGMSAVYKATDPNLRRVVAIKLIHSHLSHEPNFVRRFEEEAAAVAQLRHPHIIQVFDFDHDEDTYYMVLEFVPGETLADRMQRLNQQGRQLGVEEIVHYAAEICRAVDYAHQRGMVHRDLKPANVMLNVQGEAILMDFGIAKIIGGQHHTATGAVLGTARYMSPEQIKGVEIDRRSDIYSLGVMLFEMASGRPPFNADSAMTLMMMHINDPIPDLRQLKPDLPPALVAVIEKALSKDREQRFQSATEMAEALEAVLSTTAAQETYKQDAAPTLAAGPQEVEALKAPALRFNPPSQEIPQDDAVSGGRTFSIGFSQFNGGQVPPESPGTGPHAPSRRLDALKRAIPTPLLAAGIAGALVLVTVMIVGIIFLPRVFGNDSPGEADSQAQIAQAAGLETVDTAGTQAAASATAAALVVLDKPTATFEPTSTPTETPEPTQTYTPSPSPTPTLPTDLYVAITNIESDGTYYIVSYETYGFQEVLPGTHIHFFFDTVPVEQAGMPGSGPWKLYGGPRPFTQYRLVDRPYNATQMCARVANPDHSLYDFLSGNCYDLP